MTKRMHDLLDAVGEQLNGEDVRLVIPVLTTLLANAGLASETDYDVFIQYVINTIAIHFSMNESVNNNVKH